MATENTSGRMASALDVLKRHFGHDTFRDGQAAVISSLLDGRSALAVFPTGAGKSLCYQLPALLWPGLTLVVSPLIALMKDQVDALRSRGIAAARIDSSLSLAERDAVLDDMAAGRLRLLYIAPERLLGEAFLRRLQSVRIELMAIDEAHCISEWGHNFRPEYLRLARLAVKLGVPRVLALTATATPAVADDIARQFGIGLSDRHRTPFHRANLFIASTPVDAGSRPGRLIRALGGPGRLPAIVYATRQETTESLAALLSREGFRARAYHAGLADDVRVSVQEEFMNGTTHVVVATIAFGMGIDKAGIRSVFHFNLPKSLENYQQETGRAGRDGAPAHCELFGCGDDLIPLQNFIYGDMPDEASLRHLVDHILRLGPSFDISRYELSRSTDIRPTVLETVLTYLEQDGLIEPVASFYATAKIRTARPLDQILSGHLPAERAIIRSILTAGKAGRIWRTIEIDPVAADLEIGRADLLRRLADLEAAREIEMQPSGLRHQFRLTADPATFAPSAVASRLFQLFESRQAADLARLDRVVALATDPGCLTNHLLGYFGDPAGLPCGHCSHCLSPPSHRPVLPGSPAREIGMEELGAIEAVRRERHASLRSPRQLARFLCGLSSPATRRDRLTRHDAFGLLADIPFAVVLDQVASNHLG